jgi:hypothetical protein
MFAPSNQEAKNAKAEQLNKPACLKQQSYRHAAFLMFLAYPDFGPSGSLRCRYSLSSCKGHRSLLAGRCRSVHVDLTEGGQRRRDAVQFVRESHAFLLELGHHRLH